MPNTRNKSTTNADHIRSMTDEELATAMIRMFRFFNTHCARCREDFPNCNNCLLKWLKQPAEVD